VDDDNAAGAIAMRVRVFFGGTAVSSPAGVANAEGASRGCSRRTSSRFAQLARGTTHLEESGVGAANCDAGRIVAAIFEAAQAFDDDGDNLLTADVTHDSAHAGILCD